MQNSETIKTIRHDFRHHIAVIKSYNNSGEGEKLDAYIDELASVVSAHNDKILCKNFAVNAVAAHYLGIAESEGASVEAWLDIPEDTGPVSTMDLCVIMGNFLENAIEACRRMERGDKFIRVRSRIEGDTLSIVVTNSFDGLWECGKDGVYLSRKENVETARKGLGLASVKSVCKRYGGFAQYEITGGVWKSSALVRMGPA